MGRSSPPRHQKPVYNRRVDDPKWGSATDKALKALSRARLANLRQRYQALFGRDPPDALGPDLLRRSIAHHIQTRAYGGLSAKTRRDLDREARVVADNPTKAVCLSRKIKSGSELIRVWNGKTYRVVVSPNGYLFEGNHFSSLSEIASLITGTNWNGPRFFGLRSRTEKTAANVH
ncbi:MAG: DUF2924 domain-containing protein [Afipia sp.]|nr:DUF2924 domain-containing protein [Afipia sp.]